MNPPSQHAVLTGGTFFRPVDPRTLGPEGQRFVVENNVPPISRNSSCPCGSGKRFKRCHGKLAIPAR